MCRTSMSSFILSDSREVKIFAPNTFVIFSRMVLFPFVDNCKVLFLRISVEVGKYYPLGG